MSSVDQNSASVASAVKHPTRRNVVLAGPTLLALNLVNTRTAAASATAVIDVTMPPYNASPSLSDNSAAFQSALNALLALGGGQLNVPPGQYKFSSGLTWASTSTATGSPISIIGSGRSASVLVIQHANTAIAISFSNVSDNANVLIRDIGFACVPSANQGGTCISVAFPNTASAWEACLIENVDFGVQYPSYSTFSSAMSLTNVWNSKFSDCSFHGGFTGNASSIFVSLNGKCIDNRFVNCTLTNIGTGYLVNSYCEGLHIIDNVIISVIGVSTGAINSNYNDGANLLGLYISGSEFNTSGQALSLVQVITGWLTGTHFGLSSAGVTCALAGCEKLLIEGCTITGNGTSNATGIALVSNAGGYPGGWCTNNQIDNCEFQYVNTSISFGVTTQGSNGVADNSALGIRVLDSSGIVVNTSTVVDMNGSSSNNQAQWVTSLSGNARFGYLR